MPEEQQRTPDNTRPRFSDLLLRVRHVTRLRANLFEELKALLFGLRLSTAFFLLLSSFGLF